MTFVLQTHENFTDHGHIKHLESSPDLITPEYVRNKYGAGYFCVKQNSPRFGKPIWKGWIGQRNEDKLDDHRSVKIAALERKTDNLGLGLAAVGIGAVVAHAGAVANFVAHGERLNRIEAILAASPLTSLQTQYVCQSCHQPPFSLLDQYCGHCGVKITWADGSRLPLPNLERICPRCLAPVQANQAYCTECGVPFLNPNTDSTQASRWRLP